MARSIRFAPADLPVHVWVRGNQQQDVFYCAADRRRFLDLMVRHSREQKVEVLAYCLMNNHVHLALLPSNEDGLSWMMMRLNSEYAQFMQFRLDRRGHLWQGRFKGCVMDDTYLWTVLRYIELNPVRARIVSRADEWAWSSARVHMGLEEWPQWLSREPFSSRFTPNEWCGQLKTEITSNDRAAIWRATRLNRPLAGDANIKAWEMKFSVSLRTSSPGRPKRHWLLAQKFASSAAGS